MMNKERHQRASEIFVSASELPTEKREAYLDEVCEDDAELRAYVEKLLAHDREDSFLESLDVKMEPARLPDIIGDFRILREIGKGGMGTVYEAEQVSLKRKVALKVLPSHLRFSDEAVQKFYREAEAGGRQSHPGIVAVHAVGEHEGFHYIAQELVKDGTTLSDQLDERRESGEQPPGYFRKTALLISQVADAMYHAHEAGVIHRDIKPSNILLTGKGQPKVTDFGLARVEDALALSRTGDLAGTPYYMSPEQAMSRRIEIDKRTDIYSLGVTLYEMLTLKRPFEGETSHEILKKIILIDPLDPHKTNPKVPRDLSVVCMKAMEKSPANRYQSMGDFGADLRRFLHGEAVLAKPVGLGIRFWKRVKRNPVVSAAVGVALAAVVVFAVVVPWVMANESRKREEQAVAAKVEIEKQRNEALNAKQQATEQRNIAEAEKERALAAEKEANRQREIAEGRYKEIIRLSDMKRLKDLETEAEKLWPAYPEKIPAMRSWLGKADELAGHLEEHRAILSTLREGALPYDEKAAQQDRENNPKWHELVDYLRTKEVVLKWIDDLKNGEKQSAWSDEDYRRKKGTKEDMDTLNAQIVELDERITRLHEEVSGYRTWKFKDTETQWQYDGIEELVSGLEEFTDEEKGLLMNVKDRLEFAETIEKRSIDDYQEIWDEAIASIADEAECPQYKGLIIKPIVGFVPIGKDPDSGLWEFAHLQTGEIPLRDTKRRLFLGEEMSLVFVLLPGGVFKMGAELPSEEKPEGSPNVDPQTEPIEGIEGPVHEVTLKPFFISKYEMTQGQWTRFTGVNPSAFWPGQIFGGKQVCLLDPVENVSWNDCVKVMSNLKLRLPSESEWEYATRAGTTTVYWTGNDEKSLIGAVNLADLSCKKYGGNPDWPFAEWLDDSYPMHAPVGSFLPNAFGLHDVHGNVWEWCQDCYTPSYNSTPRDGSAYEFWGRRGRVFRGGSWGSKAFHCRSANRVAGVGMPDYHYSDHGLRPAFSLPE